MYPACLLAGCCCTKVTTKCLMQQTCCLSINPLQLQSKNCCTVVFDLVVTLLSLLHCIQGLVHVVMSSWSAPAWSRLLAHLLSLADNSHCSRMLPCRVKSMLCRCLHFLAVQSQHLATKLRHDAVWYQTLQLHKLQCQHVKIKPVRLDTALSHWALKLVSEPKTLCSRVLR